MRGLSTFIKKVVSPLFPELSKNEGVPSKLFSIFIDSRRYPENQKFMRLIGIYENGNNELDDNRRRLGRQEMLFERG